MLRPASQQRSCARLGDREGFGWPAQAVRHDAVALRTVGDGRGPHQHERRGVRVQAGQQNRRAAGAGAAIRPGIGRRLRRRSVVMARQRRRRRPWHRHRQPDDRQPVIGCRDCERARDSGRRSPSRGDARRRARRPPRTQAPPRPPERSRSVCTAIGRNESPCAPTSSRIGMILIVRISPVQIESGNTRHNCAYLVAFGKDPGSATQNASRTLGYRQRRLPIEHPEIWPKSSSCRISRM